MGLKITKRWLEMSEIYKKFVPKEECYDFGNISATNMFLFESTGNPKLNLTDKIDGKFNGFLVGKHWMDATIKMWKADLEDGIITIDELKNDFPEWFLIKIKLI